MGVCGGKQSTQANAASKGASDTIEGDFKIEMKNTNVDAELGVEAKYPDNKYILVESVKDDGLIPSWNKANVNTDNLVNPGDMLVAINGKFGSSDDMLAECKAEFITILVKRAPAPASVPEATVAEKQGAGASAIESPTAENPVTEAPLAEHPVAEVPAAEKAVAEVPAAEDAVAEVPAAEDTVAEVPVSEGPAAEGPAEKVTATTSADAELGQGDGSVNVEPEQTEVDPTATVEKKCIFC
jgi:hypothetical protein